MVESMVHDHLEDAPVQGVPKTSSATQTQSQTGHNTTRFTLDDKTVDDVRPLRVAVIGAGISGINAGILLPAKVPNIRLTIFDKNSDGGTWLENVYPGVRCDVPANVYQSTFAPNTQWTEIFAQGKEILDYWRVVAKEHNVYQYIRFNHRVTSLNWDGGHSSEWTVHFETDGGKSAETFDFVLLAIGQFNQSKLPRYEGIDQYRDHLRHTANWDPAYDAKGKRVAVIGNGASGIQVLPLLQQVAGHVDHYARNKTWIAGSWAGDARTLEPQYFGAEQLQGFHDPSSYLKYRKEEEDKYWRGSRGVFPGSTENNQIRDVSLSIMKQRLVNKPQLLDQLVPDFSPHCRRLTPGPGYLEALDSDNVDYISTPIKRFTPTGIETTDGILREVDAVFCATGATPTTQPPFPIYANGFDLRDQWAPGGKWGFPYTYFGLATPGYPNLLWVMGPHAGATTGTVPHTVELTLTYHAQLLRKVSTQGIRTIQPSTQAVDDFVQYARQFFSKPVFAEQCSSWANGGKPGAFIHAFWPGSGAHMAMIRREPRWEDWEYSYSGTTNNRFEYFGPGWTKKELEPESDLVGYLKLPSEIDLRSLHEKWSE